MTNEEYELKMVVGSNLGYARDKVAPVMEMPKIDTAEVYIDDVRRKELQTKIEAIKHDSGKADWSLMPFEAVEEINKVLEFGAKKYAAHNWKQGGGFKYTRILNSLLRHIFAFMRGEDKDPESGLSHMAHAGCNILFILYYLKYKDKYSNDDRITEG